MEKARYDQLTIALFGPLVLMLMSFPNAYWMPAVLVGVYAITAYPHMPNLKDTSAIRLLQWHIIRPMLASAAAMTMLFGRGVEETPIIFALAIALMSAFMMGNMVAFIVAAIPNLLRHPTLQEIAKQKPASFTMMVFVFFLVVVCVLAIFETTYA